MTTATKQSPKKDLTRAEELMRIHAQSLANKKDLFDTIRNEMEAYDKNIKETAEELKQIGERNKAIFDEKGNLQLEHGYLHISNSVVVVQGRKFDLATFHAAHPELVDVELKRGEIKKLFQDKEGRKELISLGIQTDNEQTIQVKVGSATKEKKS